MTFPFKVTVTNSVCLSVCLSHLFLSHALTRNFFFDQLTRYGQASKPIEFEVDQAMVIRIIRFMS